MASPTAFEQEMLELINRARANPAGEFDAIVVDQATSTGVTNDVTNALRFFGVDLALFKTQISAFNPVAPLAWSDALNIAANAHSSVMITQDTQAHELPGELGVGARITAAGYSWNAVAENIFAYTQTAIHGHAGFVVDWGSGPGGMQSPAGHRATILSSNYTEIGIGVIAESNSATSVGPNVVTQDFGNRFNYQSQLVGTVFNDGDGDKFYDAGEGLGAVSITVTGSMGTYTTQSWGSGGYQLQVPSGSYTVTFSGGGLVSSQSKTFSIGSDNVKVDAIAGDSTVPPPTFEALFAANTSQAKGISALYETLLGGVPNQAGFTFLINGNNSTNFGAGPGPVFNDENIYINIANALVQGNAAATTAFNALATGATLVDQITSLYQTIIPVASRSTDGLAYLTSTANLAFYTAVAAERGITSDNGPAIIAFASLLKIAVDGNIGVGNAVNDLLAAVNNSTAALPETSADLIPIETADGTAFDGDDVIMLTASSAFALSAGEEEVSASGYEVIYASLETASDDQFLELLYLNILDRAPDAEGFSYWQSALDHGVERELVVASFSESIENQANVIGIIDDGIWFG